MNRFTKCLVLLLVLQGYSVCLADTTVASVAKAPLSLLSRVGGHVSEFAEALRAQIDTHLYIGIAAELVVLALAIGIVYFVYAHIHLIFIVAALVGAFAYSTGMLSINYKSADPAPGAARIKELENTMKSLTDKEQQQEKLLEQMGRVIANERATPSMPSQ